MFDIKHISSLAKINLGPEEEKQFQKEFLEILAYFESLKKAGTSKVQPDFYFFEDSEKNLRQDNPAPEKEDVVNKIVQAFPCRHERHLKTKAVF